MTAHHSACRATFNFNGYSPAEIQALIESVGVKKAALPALPCSMLASLAGVRESHITLSPLRSTTSSAARVLPVRLLGDLSKGFRYEFDTGL